MLNKEDLSKAYEMLSKYKTSEPNVVVSQSEWLRLGNWFDEMHDDNKRLREALHKQCIGQGVYCFPKEKRVIKTCRFYRICVPEALTEAGGE